MRTYSLSPRLHVIAEFALDAKNVADIGCDHGKISIYLANQGANVHAVDISQPSLEKAKKLAAIEGVEDNIKFYCDDGLQSIQNVKLDAVIIAGMGHRMIKSILDNNIESVKKISALILQPMDSVVEMRASLCSNGYTILNEKLVWDEGRLYTVIKAKYIKNQSLTLKELLLGPKIIENNDELLNDLIEKEINKRETILSGLSKAQNKNTKLIDKVKNELKILRGED